MISVILATKNGSAFIERAIRSVLNQSERNFQLIIVDDKSTDTTRDVVERICLIDPRVKLVSTPSNIGPGKARDLGIQTAQKAYDAAAAAGYTLGKEHYIALIDDDDEWINKYKLANQKAFLDVHPGHALVGSATIFNVDAQGKPFPNEKKSKYTVPETDKDIRQQILRRNCFVTSSVMFRKRIYDAVGGFKPMFLAEEYDLWLRMGLIAKLGNIHHCAVRYTIRPDSISKTRQKEMYATVLELVKEYKKSYPHPTLGLMKARARVLFLNFKHLF